MPSYRIGSILGIPIELDLTFLLILPVFAYVIGSQVGEWVGILNDVFGTAIAVAPLTGEPAIAFGIGTAAAIALFASVLLHELGHSVVAMRYDVEITSIKLWLFGGVAQLSRFPDDWRQELYIAIAGPIVSVLLGGAFFLAFRVFPGSGGVAAAAISFTLGYLALTNVALAAFNMLPGFPMDGGRVLRALWARNQPYAVATRRAAAVGKAFAFLLGFFALFGGAGINLYLVAIAFFIYMGASSEAQQTMLRAAFEGVSVGDVMTPVEDVDTVDAETSVAALVDRMFRTRHTGFPVVQNDRLVGMVTLEDARKVDEVERDAYRVEEIMSRDLHTIDPGEDAMEAFSRMQEHGVGRLVVVREDSGHEEGAFTGIISRTDLMTALDIIQSSGGESGAPSLRRGTERDQSREI
ncbi:CBS domain-containing protein [Haloglomus salinum]|uniref:CBS domain-containing protein n=1 Tax=Haloglomus salinum TaxID=2962673 RepID=UPI0020C96456|nr:CBS domain-containing protein [Haloglomus salinum]